MKKKIEIDMREKKRSKKQENQADEERKYENRAAIASSNYIFFLKFYKFRYHGIIFITP